MKQIERTMPSPVCYPDPELAEGERSPVAGTLAGCHPERAVEGALRSVRGLWERVNSARKVSAAVLREIFDESAYERFLARRQLSSSPGAYAAFCRDHHQSKERRPRCC